MLLLAGRAYECSGQAMQVLLGVPLLLPGGMWPVPFLQLLLVWLDEKGAENASFASRFLMATAHLPSQARGKHKETLQNTALFAGLLWP
jgi:hypothetical protein